MGEPNLTSTERVNPAALAVEDAARALDVALEPQRPRPALGRAFSPSHLAGAACPVVPLQAGVIGRRTELVLKWYWT